MNKQLRCYSVKYSYRHGELVQTSIKYYYNFDADLVPNFHLNVLENYQICNAFEMSSSFEDSVLGYNFHNKGTDSLMKCLKNDELKQYMMMSNTLGQSFFDYTRGIRIKDNRISELTFYFAPILYKEGKIKMTGIKKEENICEKLRNYISILNLTYDDECELKDLLCMCEELKGVGFHTGDNKGYGIFLKFSHRILQKYFNESWGIIIKPGHILFSIRIRENKIIGYNIYYPGDFCIPCYGWGESID